MDLEIEKIKQEYDAKQKSKKAKKKAKDDEDKKAENDDSKAEKERDEKVSTHHCHRVRSPTVNSVDQSNSGWLEHRHSSRRGSTDLRFAEVNPSVRLKSKHPAVLTINRNFYQLRVERLRSVAQQKVNQQRFAQKDLFPSVPKGDIS